MDSSTPRPAAAQAASVAAPVGVAQPSAVLGLRDGLGIVGSARETEAMAQSLASNDGVYFVPALTGLGAPDCHPAEHKRSHETRWTEKCASAARIPEWIATNTAC